MATTCVIFLTHVINTASITKICLFLIIFCVFVRFFVSVLIFIEIQQSKKLKNMSKKARHNQKEITNPVLIQINRIIEERESGSVAAFCSKIGVNVANYYMWVKRDGAPSAETIERISNTYTISIGWFGGGEGQNKNQGTEEYMATESTSPQFTTLFYLRLHERCKEKNITPERLTAIIGGAKSLPSLMKNYGKIPTKRKIAEIAKCLDVEPDYFTRADVATMKYDATSVREFFCALGRVGEQIMKALAPMLRDMADAGNNITMALANTVGTTHAPTRAHTDVAGKSVAGVVRENVEANMATIRQNVLTDDEQALLRIFRGLSSEDRFDFIGVVNEYRRRIKP